MRRNRFVHALVLLCLLLAACAQDTEPPEMVTFTPAPPDPTAPAAASPPAATELATPSVTPPTPESPVETTEPTPSQATSLRPAYLRAFRFGIAAGNSYHPGALGIHPGLNRLYARTHRQGSGAAGLVTAIDLASGQVLAVAETGIDPYGEGALAVDPHQDRVYAVNPAQWSARDPDPASTCTVLDASTLETVTVLDDVELLALDPENGRLAVAGRKMLRVLDAAGYGLLAELAIPPGHEILTLAADPAMGRLAVVRREPGGAVLAVYDTATLSLLDYEILPGRVDFLVADPVGGRWVASGSDGQLNRLWAFDADLELGVDLPLGERMLRSPLALDSSGSRLYVGRQAYPLYSILAVDLSSGQVVDEIPLDLPPYALAYDAASGRLLASHTYDHRIGGVDVLVGAVLDTWPTAIQIDDVALDPARGYLLATDSLGRLRVLDAATGNALAELPGEGRVSVDSAHGRVYTGGLGGRRVRIGDLDSLQITAEIRSGAIPVADTHGGGLYLVKQGIYLASLETLTTTALIPGTEPQNPGFSPNPTAIDAYVDPGTGRVFAVFTNGVPGSNSGTYLYVYDPVTYVPILQDTERSPWHLDIDPTNGTAYVSRAHLAGVSTSLLEEGRTYAARVEGLFGPVRVDPELGIVYLTSGSQNATQLWILDAATLDVVDSLSLPDTLKLCALDTEGHLLYLCDVDGNIQVWSATGGLPPAAHEPERIDVADLAPRRLYLPPGDQPLFATDLDYRAVVSGNGGLSWALTGAGLPEAWVLDLAFSPGYAQDGTMWAGMAEGDEGYGIWTSTDGGRRWTVTSEGLTDLQVTALAISPSYDQDQTLFATTRRKGLFRSVDGGATWQRLTGRYQPPDAYDGLTGALVLSPAFGQDCEGCSTLFIDSNGLQRSTDGGETWEEIEVGAPGYGSGTLAFSPSFAANHRLAYFWVPIEAQVEVWVYVTDDGGDTWQSSGQVPGVQGYAASSVLVAPDGTVYLLWSPWSDDEPRQVYRSRDLFAAVPPIQPTWEVLGSELPATTPLELSADGSAFLALDADWRLARWPAADLIWQPAAPQPTAVPPTRTPEPTAPAGPSVTPSPTPCSIQPVRFGAIWQPRHDRMGCALDLATELALAEQSFERGRMLWDSQSLLVYVLQDPGGSKTAPWKAYADTWVEGVDPAWDTALPPPPQQPQRGFGKVWREKLGGPAAEIGWALESERPVTGWRQRFESATLFWTDAPSGGASGVVYLLYDDGAWEAIPWPSS